MKKGIRILGIAESYQGKKSNIAGIVMRKDLIIDGFEFGYITVGKLDATKTIINIYKRMKRDDINIVMISGLALAWYNIVDIQKINKKTNKPIISVTYEKSEGLTKYIKKEFKKEEKQKRLNIYNKQPKRTKINISKEKNCYIRYIGIKQKKAEKLIKDLTKQGKKPEPLRVAKLAAHAYSKNKKN